MEFRRDLRWLRQAIAPKKIVLACPECGERFEVYGEDPAVEFLAYWWKCEQGAVQEPPQELRHIVAHKHDVSEFLDVLSGDPWLGTFFAGNLDTYDEDAEDLSDQAQK